MKATVLHDVRDIRLDDRPDPSVKAPTDAVVKVVRTCICGSDLWPYRGDNGPIDKPRPIGHEFVGVIEDTGSAVRQLKRGQFVIGPFKYSDNTCDVCRHGVQTSCLHGGFYGAKDELGIWVDACQGEFIRVPHAEGTLVATRKTPTDAQLASLLALSDVMGTGWHAASSARVREGDTVVVVGDGAVGLCAMLAAVRQAAGRVIAMSRHEPRQQVALEFGVNHVVAERGDDGIARIKELTDGRGADVVLECVGTKLSMDTAFEAARPGGRVGFVGVPHGVEVPVETMFRKNISLSGGVAPVRKYLPTLVDDVLAGTIDPGKVFDLTLPLADVAEGYRAMDERRAIKVMLEP